MSKKKRRAKPHKPINTNNKLIAGWVRFRRNKLAMAGLIVILLLVLVAIFADYIAPFPYEYQNLRETFQKPSATHPLGTDNLGRCTFSRIVYGTQVSLKVGLISVGISMVAGVILGVVAGFYGSVAETVIMRVIDILMAIPSIILAICIAAALGNSLTNVMIAVGIGQTPAFARIVRVSVMAAKDQEYVEAARSIHASDVRILGEHIIPNCLAPIIVQATQGIANAILNAASLSFIGLGVQAPVPEWGAMLSTARQFLLTHSELVLYPGLAIMVTVLAIALVGDGLRDALDPRLK